MEQEASHQTLFLMIFLVGRKQKYKCQPFMKRIGKVKAFDRLFIGSSCALNCMSSIAVADFQRTGGANKLATFVRY